MRKKLILWGMAGLCATGYGQPRQEINLKTWEFSRNNHSWEQVDIPHDWAIAGPFDKKWDLQKVAITQNGETEATEKSGRSGALPWIGKGYYKRSLTIPAGYHHAELVFDGAMAEPRVRVNGQEAGYWAYGYNAFRLDITDLVKQSGGEGDDDGWHPVIMRKDNLLEVDLQNLEESSRWYPGAGLYRPVKLILTGENWIDSWKTFIRTSTIEGDKATIEVTTGCGGPLDAGLYFEMDLCDQQGHVVANCHSKEPDNDGKVTMTLSVDNPHLWTPETPYLYKAHIRFKQENSLLDEITQNVGIRTVKVSKENGFQLNGVTRKLKGVCLHHDLGPLGAAINKAALIRQIRILKDMGCDAIRTAHNMPSQMQMEICDSMGMMVMAESFDMWLYPKCKNGYARFFEEWSDQDIENLILSNRNHPSIVMWSIGNEIPEQWSEEGKEIACHLQDICHQLDPTRPVTQGMDRAEDALKSGFAQVMDVPGFNYRVHKYENNIKQLPQGFLLGSETASTVSSRGVYKFPVEITDNSQFASYSPNYDPTALEKADGQCSSYDVEYCSWSNLPDDDWRCQDDFPWVIGEFVWTGFDYLGEPTPYDEYWPSRSSYFGICDLAGLPKDRYWLYRSKWNTKEHTVHLLPHWTWQGREGQVTPVYCYTDGVEAELFVNGKSQGRIRKNPAERLDRYRLRWNDVKYEPGEIRVVAYDAQGNEIGQDSKRTAGKPVALIAEADRNSYRANGEDLAFVTVSVKDAKHIPVPTCDNELTFSVEGTGCFEAVCNGDATSLESFKQPQMKLFNGKLVVVLRTTSHAGNIQLSIKDVKGELQPATLIIPTHD
ncbi:MAG: DUF4982 domain-containing protein [Prevotella sp.]|nr:DUF4982 domain-containing protein [Prevotella sp.]